MEQIRISGLAWFAEDDYDSFRRVLPDRAWHRTYALWLAAAEQSEKRIQQQGVRVVKAHVRSDTFVEWCRATGRRIETKALLDFSNEAALRAYTGEEGH